VNYVWRVIRGHTPSQRERLQRRVGHGLGPSMGCVGLGNVWRNENWKHRSPVRNVRFSWPFWSLLLVVVNDCCFMLTLQFSHKGLVISLPCRVSTMGWVESGEGFNGLGWVGLGWVRWRLMGWVGLGPKFLVGLGCASCGLRGCKNGPAPFPGRMSYKATKPGL